MLSILCLVFPAIDGCERYVQFSTTTRALVEHHARDVASVRVSGTVQQLEHRIVRSGFAYDVFLICDGACIRVFHAAPTAVRDGDSVSVTGTFYARRHVGQAIYRNEIEADGVTSEGAP